MRLIDADKLLNKLEDWRGDKDDLDFEDGHDVAYYSAMSRAMLFTKLAPTIDAVPVVHEKDIRSSVITVKDSDEWQDRIILADEATQVCAVYYADGSDVVPVVRCVDCKHRCTFVCPMYHTETCLDDLDGFDDYDVDRTDDDGFCHLGERWEGEDDDQPDQRQNAGED